MRLHGLSSLASRSSESWFLTLKASEDSNLANGAHNLNNYLTSDISENRRTSYRQIMREAPFLLLS